ncbi:thioredoxin [Nitrosococcus oceani]|uniref:Thioredoxin n=2 Tax=Nitrosococcus oceani TaxID=1229 RepID=Q3JDH4_NITOC|nr:thioredoxin [Nitrosococcus oceani]KFI20383.1 thioredoxin [Nitrosococcus oceani C-27]ABA57122.1 Thioredoxin domain-containing protein [Nitrosococcus oceani ATCC 19707]EDZ66075.1 Thioredoxin domain protein [Nitrosococcus oceani AFC27]KFI23533.1 thioredoxin [Nitrosococcus oceani]GEM19858.1 thioredoxin [Nitrosococcus oceani]
MSENNYILDITEANFAEQVLTKSYQTPVLVDFWAAWCQPCQMLMPLLKQLAESYQGQFWLAKVNADEAQSLTHQYGVRGLPTLKLFRHSEVVEELVGVQPESAIRAAIDRHLIRESDLLLEQAQTARATGQEERSLELLHRAAEIDPKNHRISLTLAETLLKQGEIAEAEQILTTLPREIREEEPASGLLAQIEFTAFASRAPDIALLKQRLKTNPEDSEARYLLGVQQAFSRDYQGALEQFLDLLKRDPKYGDSAARKALLAVFSILGSDHELVPLYRRQMFRCLH